MTRAVPEAIREIRELDQWVAYTHNKVPIGKDGRPADSTDPATWLSLDDAKWIRQVQGLKGVGFVFSETDPYVGIDLDHAIDPGTGELKGWAAAVVDRFDSYTELSPGGLGVHIWIRGELPRPGARVKGIEVYGSKRYFTVTGQHLSGTPASIEDRRDVLDAWYAETFEREEDRGGGPVSRYDGVTFEAPGVETWLGRALDHIHDDDYDTWVRVGMAIKSELGDAGFDYWDTWSAGSPKYDGRQRCWKKWQKLGGERIGIATVVWLAGQNGFKVPAGQVIVPEGFRDGWDEWLDRQGIEDGAGADEGLSLRVFNFTEQYTDRSEFEPDLISPGFLGTGDLALVFGPPKSMKSLWITDFFRQMACGQDWYEFSPIRPLRVFYIQFEVKAEKMRQRIQMVTGLEPVDLQLLSANFFYTDRFTAVMGPGFVAECERAAREAFAEVMPDVIIMDPIANIYSGDNENDNAQMSQFLRECKLLRNAINPQAALVLVHHSGKMSREERFSEPFNAFRGASSLRGSYDAGVSIDVGEDRERRISFELRNGPEIGERKMTFEGGRFIRQGSGDADVDGFDPFGGVRDEWRPTGVNEERTWVFQTLLSEAEEGRVYTGATFSDTFAGGALGSESKIKRIIRRMKTRDELRMFETLHERAELQKPHHRSGGYLACRGMTFVFWSNEGVGESFDVVPQLRMDSASGQIVECEGW